MIFNLQIAAQHGSTDDIAREHQGRRMLLFSEIECVWKYKNESKVKKIIHSFASQPGSSSHTRWITLWALQIRSWPKCGTKRWSEIHRICGSSWKLKFIFTKFYWSVVVFFWRRSLTRAFPCCTRQNLVEDEPRPLISGFRIYVLSFPQEETWGSDDGLKS